MERYEFIGYVADDAKVINSTAGKFISFCVGVTNKYKKKDGSKVEKTKWIDCTRNGDEAFAQYLKKGQQVFVSGTADVKAYKDKAGNPAASITCRVQEIMLLAKPKMEDAPF